MMSTKATAVVVTNMEVAKTLIRAEPRFTTWEIQESLSIRMVATMSILHDHLRVRKQCAMWILHSLTDEQRWGRVEWYEFMLWKFNGGCSKLTWEVLIVDETNGSIDMIRKPRCSQRFGCFRMNPHPKKSRSAQKKMVACVFLWKIRPPHHHSSWGQTNSHSGLVRASLSPEGLRSLVPAPSKDGTVAFFLQYDLISVYLFCSAV